jgi:gamma-glutamyltranspeptidase/glutathione hydrolase
MAEPCSTGIGGDMFALYFDAKTNNVSALNGSGRAGKMCTLETIRKDLGLSEGERGKPIPFDNIHAVTVPGAAAGWVDTVEKFGSGKLSMKDILSPAIEMGEKGFPVSELTAKSVSVRPLHPAIKYYLRVNCLTHKQWKRAEPSIRKASPNFAEMLKKDKDALDGCRAPGPGEIMKNPTLAHTFRRLAEKGKKGFYTGEVAEEIVRVCKERDGRLELGDLQNHMELGTELVNAPLSSSSPLIFFSLK